MDGVYKENKVYKYFEIYLSYMTEERKKNYDKKVFYYVCWFIWEFYDYLKIYGILVKVNKIWLG